jgi:hypothetical protein
MYNNYPLLMLVCESNMKFGEWITVLDQITREVHGKDIETTKLAFELYGRIKNTYGFLEYEGEVNLTMESKTVLMKIIDRKGLSQKYVNTALTKIDQQLGKSGLRSKFKK